MNLRLLSRDDASLTVALVAAVVLLFHQPLRWVFDIAQSVETQYHVDLLPALVLLVTVFVFHQYRKWQVAQATAQTAVVEAARANTRSKELESLVTFGRALANALDRPTLERVLWSHLPAFVDGCDPWILIRQNDHWQSYLQEPGGAADEGAAREARATRILSEAADAGNAGREDGADVCFPLVAGEVIGVLGITGGARLTEEQRRALGAAATVLAIAIKNARLFESTRELSLRDELTRCFNRRHGMDVLDAELRRAKRTRSALSIVMFDIDHFKILNDELGHVRGDELLRLVGMQLSRIVRTTDTRCRYGGDEFLVILPDTPLAGAEQVAESIRREMGNLTISSGDRLFSATVSVGVASAVLGELDVTGFLARADEALYRAKRAGRNQFCISDAPAPYTAESESRSAASA